MKNILGFSGRVEYSVVRAAHDLKYCVLFPVWANPCSYLPRLKMLSRKQISSLQIERISTTSCQNGDLGSIPSYGKLTTQIVADEVSRDLA